MELAELKAAGESFKQNHDPHHTGLENPTAEEIMKWISHICHVHCKWCVPFNHSFLISLTLSQWSWQPKEQGYAGATLEVDQFHVPFIKGSSTWIYRLDQKSSSSTSTRYGLRILAASCTNALHTLKPGGTISSSPLFSLALFSVSLTWVQSHGHALNRAQTWMKLSMPGLITSLAPTYHS